MSSEVRFTRAQKWDLVRISAAAVASTVFFTVPLFLIRPQPAPRQAAKAEARDVAPTTVVDTKAPDLSSGSLTPAAAPGGTDTVSVVTSTEFATATTPALQKNVRAVRTIKPAPAMRARANTGSAPPSLSRRVARFIAGTGKYTVKPFPTVSAPEN